MGVLETVIKKKLKHDIYKKLFAEYYNYKRISKENTK